MSVENRSLSEELVETQRVRKEYRPLGITKAWGRVIEESTNTTAKKIGGFAITGIATAASIGIDGNVGIGIAEVLGIVGGATIGEKVPFISGPERFVRKKKALKIVREKADVSVGEIASLLLEFPDTVAKEEVELWPKKQLGEESLRHPERYLIMRAVLNNNPEAPDRVVEEFMEAQKIAQKKRRSKEYMLKEALEKTGELIIGVSVMSGTVNAVSFLLGHPHQAGLAGAADDIVFLTVLAITLSKEKIKSFFSS